MSSSDNLVPGGHTKEEIEAAVQELTKLGYTIYEPNEDKLVQCFICNQWQPSKYTRPFTFNEMAEPVCLNCAAKLREREDSLEERRIEEEL